MPVLNQANVRNAKRHLATMAGVLKSVASGDSEGAIQTLESIVGGDDHDQFEDLLDSQETLAHLIKIAEASVDEDEEDEDDSEEDFDDEDEEDEEDEEVVTSSVKSMTKKQMKQRAKFLAIAEAEFEEEDEEEDFDEEEDLEEDEDLDEEETLEEDEDEDEDEDADDEDADDEVVAKTTARFKANLKSRSKAQAGVAKPKVSAKAPKAKSDGRL